MWVDGKRKADKQVDYPFECEMAMFADNHVRLHHFMNPFSGEPNGIVRMHGGQKVKGENVSSGISFRNDHNTDSSLQINFDSQLMKVMRDLRTHHVLYHQEDTFLGWKIGATEQYWNNFVSNPHTSILMRTYDYKIFYHKVDFSSIEVSPYRIIDKL